MNTNDKVTRLVDEWAQRFETDIITGIKELNEAYKNNGRIVKSLLTVIALKYPQYETAIYSYLDVRSYLEEKDGEEPDKSNENKNVAIVLGRLIRTKMCSVSLFLEFGEDDKALQTMEDAIQHMLDFRHYMEVEPFNVKAQTPEGLAHDICTSIKAAEKHLDRLADFVIIANQDKILKEMVAFKKTMAVFEERIQEFIESRF